MRKMMLIVNPNAGRGSFHIGFVDAVKKLSDAEIYPTLYFTKERDDATRLAASYAAGYDIVACMGGDGTLSEVVAGLMTLDNPPPIGYFPLGTTNDVASTLGLPKGNLPDAAGTIINGTPHPFDIGLFGEEKYFAYVAAFGAFTEVSYATPQDQKRVLGRLAYIIQGAASLPNIEPHKMRVEYDDGAIEGSFLYGGFSNSTSIAGVIKLPEQLVCLGDGKSELILVPEQSLEDYGLLAANILHGTIDTDRVFILHTKKARFISENPVAWTRDGEDGGAHTDLTLKTIHAPVSIIF